MSCSCLNTCKDDSSKWSSVHALFPLRFTNCKSFLSFIAISRVLREWPIYLLIFPSFGLASHVMGSRYHLRTIARKTSTIQIFFILWLQSDNELPMSEMQKNWGVTDFVFKIKRVENYPNFDKSALATRHGLSAC